MNLEKKNKNKNDKAMEITKQKKNIYLLKKNIV